MTTSASTQARRLLRRARRVRRRARAVQRRGSRKLDSLTKALRSEVPGVAEWRREFLQLCSDLEQRVEVVCKDLVTARDVYRGQRLALLNRRQGRRVAERATRDDAALRVRVVPDEEVAVALTVSPLQPDSK